MPNFLDSLQLPDQVIWLEQHQSQDVAQSVTPLLGGNVHIHSAPILSGQEITLQFAEGVEWADQATVDAIKTLAATPGATYTLQWDAVSYSVAFRHDQPPSVQFAPIWPMYDQYVGEVRLIRL